MSVRNIALWLSGILYILSVFSGDGELLTSSVFMFIVMICWNLVIMINHLNQRVYKVIDYFAELGETIKYKPGIINTIKGTIIQWTLPIGAITFLLVLRIIIYIVTSY